MKQNFFLLIIWLSAFTMRAQVPANDDCDHAIVIDQANFSMNEDATDATNNNGGLDVCGSPAWGMNDGVWFKLTGTGGDVNLAVVPTGWNCQVDVYSGSCGTFTCVLGLNNGVTDEQEAGLFFADNGVDYFINVGHWAYDATNPQADSPEGPFSINVNGAILVGVAEQQLDNFAIYLDKTTQQLHLTSGVTLKHVSIYNLTGQQIWSTEANDLQISIDFTTFNKGLYLVKVASETQTGTYKIVN